MTELLTTENLISLLTLTALEIVLGIDNIVFISILTGKLPPSQQKRTRNIGLTLALVMRLGLLFAITWVMGLTATLFTLFGVAMSGKSLILLGGGLFLVAKATHEIYEKLEVEREGAERAASSARSMALMLTQIILLDLVFSLDSVITAVGMADEVAVMVTAMLIAVAVMIFCAGWVSDFVNRHPSMKILALSFLILIGVMLVADGMGEHVPKGYIYFAMAFSLGVEVLNIRIRKKQAAPVELHERIEEGP